MNKLFLAAFLIFILPVSFYSQDVTKGTVKGKVTDLETKEPLTSATVFLENTTYGTASDITGSYEILNVEPGSYHLIISMVGYEIKRIPVRITAGSHLELEIKLKQRPVVLGQVNVTGNLPDEWNDYIDIFTREFIGKGKFSGDVKLLNPEVINFRKDEKTKNLIAFSDSIIILENKALGYKLFVVLEKFSYSVAGDVDYLTRVRFQELKAESDDEKSEWKDNRLYCYLGSQRHFFSSLINKRLFDEGFQVRKGYMITLSSGGGSVVSEEDFNLEAFGGEFLRVNLDMSLKVEYTGRNSAVTFITPGFPYFILLDSQGNRVDANNLKVTGGWAEQRMSFALPYNYLPGD
ncbi:MAG TPA: carboxypeptidase-like regulatory domain-containing protein [Ignavibacteriales bacterium]|nr:carboxypeptidase-like regulatory domain-containing protein [Ignavibacteriales bacterium]